MKHRRALYGTVAERGGGAIYYHDTILVDREEKKKKCSRATNALVLFSVEKNNVQQKLPGTVGVVRIRYRYTYNVHRCLQRIRAQRKFMTIWDETATESTTNFAGIIHQRPGGR